MIELEMKAEDKQLLIFLKKLLKNFKKGATREVYPLFLPENVSLDAGKIQSNESATNLKHGLRTLGVTFYYLSTGWSELNRESFLFDGYPAFPSVCWPALELLLSEGEISIEGVEEKLKESQVNPEKIVKKATKATNSLGAETQRILEALESTFDQQADTLIQKEYYKAANLTEEEFLAEINPLREKLPEIAKELEERPVPDNRRPILLTISKDFVSIKEQLERIELNNEKGYTGLTLSKLSNIEGLNIPQGKCYIMVDVEDGTTMKNTRPDQFESISKEKFNGEIRSPFITEEGLSLTTHHTEILNDHYLDLSGSRCDSPGHVPNLRLSGGQPKLIYGDADGTSSRWGSPSCRSRIGF